MYIIYVYLLYVYLLTNHKLTRESISLAFFSSLCCSCYDSYYYFDANLFDRAIPRTSDTTETQKHNPHLYRLWQVQILYNFAHSRPKVRHRLLRVYEVHVVVRKMECVHPRRRKMMSYLLSDRQPVVFVPLLNLGYSISTSG
jgi:hypothetical protein